MSVADDDRAATVSTSLGGLRVRTIGTGPPAVLWHSLFVDSTSWDRVRDDLAKHRRLIMIDGPGHGGSDAYPHRFALADCATAACEVLDALGVVEPVDWVGNAWGGHVGLLFAAASPKRCRTVAVIGTPARALNRSERRRIVPMGAVYRLVGPAQFLVKGVVDALVGNDASADDKRIVSTAFKRATRRGMLVAMRSVMLDRPSLTSVLATIGTPALVVTIADDAYESRHDARAEAAKLSDGSFVVLPGSGHVAPLLQSPAELVQALTAFWDDPAGFAISNPVTDPELAARG
jgi:pimeloyl-ACP methyl ester carboxylesterase